MVGFEQSAGRRCNEDVVVGDAIQQREEEDKATGCAYQDGCHHGDRRIDLWSRYLFDEMHDAVERGKGEGALQ